MASSPLVEGRSCWLRWSIEGWEVEEVSCAFVRSSEVLETAFLDCSSLVCWFGWEGADRFIIGWEGSDILGDGEADLGGFGG